MARNDKLPKEPGLPRSYREPLDWLHALTVRLFTLLKQTIDSVNLLIDGYLLAVPSLPTANETNRLRMAVLRGGVGARDRFYVERKTAADTYEWVELLLASAAFTNVLTATGTLDIASVPNGSLASTTITVTGAAVEDVAIATLSTIGPNNILISAFVQAADTVRVVFRNDSGAAWDPASGTLRVYVIKP